MGGGAENGEKTKKNTYFASGFLLEFLKNFTRYFEEKNVFTGDPATRWQRRQKIDFLNKKLQCHHMIPRWKEETFAIIVVKKSSKNKIFSPSYSYFRVRRR